MLWIGHGLSNNMRCESLHLSDGMLVTRQSPSIKRWVWHMCSEAFETRLGAGYKER